MKVSGLEGTITKYLTQMEKEGRIIHCSKETTNRIDNKIADAFLKASREAEKRQLKSWTIMKNKVLNLFNK